MIKSMTGFGRAEYSDGKRKITVEIKSVNHRYLDVNLKMPKKLGFFETSIRNLLKEYMQRGKVDLYMTYEDFDEENVSIKYNRDVAKSYLHYLNEISDLRMIYVYRYCQGIRRCSPWRNRRSTRMSSGRISRIPCVRPVKVL